ncbi:MAG: ACP S-malonyltransferase [Planctomycetaceae bacterium]
MTTAILCPGQGAQCVGMGIDWAERSAAAREVFARASGAIGLDLLALCGNGPQERLVRTDVCQPAILAVSAAALAGLEEEGRMRPSQAGAALGLSLGEYTALTVAGVLGLEDAVRLVRLRGEAMQAASDAVASGMVSLLGADPETAERVCAEAVREGGVCVVANLNAPGQVVISGDDAALARAERAAAAAGVRRAIRLDVAGAFHSPLMEPARKKLEEAIRAAAFLPARIPVYSNATAQASRDPDRLRANLVRQLTSPVLFEASVRRAKADGVARFFELSPGRVLTGLVKKIDRATLVEACEGGAAA